MRTRNLRIISILILVLLSATFLAACGSGSTNTNPPANSAPATPTTAASTSADLATGQAIMQQACSSCHNIGRVTSAQKDAAQWKITVDRMVARGAKVAPTQEQALIDYLAATYK